MPLKAHKPYTPSRRHMVLSDFAEITKSTPERSLVKAMKSKAGRNSAGRISVRHRGGGAATHCAEQEGLHRAAPAVPHRARTIALREER